MTKVYIATTIPIKVKEKMDALIARGYHATQSELIRMALVRYLREIEKEDRELEAIH